LRQAIIGSPFVVLLPSVMAHRSSKYQPTNITKITFTARQKSDTGFTRMNRREVVLTSLQSTV
jgi:hypothetical protein